MEGERRVLQQRIEAAPLDRGRVEPLERVGGDDDEEQEGHADRALHRQHPRLEAGRKIVAGERHRGTVERQDEDP